MVSTRQLPLIRQSIQLKERSRHYSFDALETQTLVIRLYCLQISAQASEAHIGSGRASSSLRRFRVFLSKAFPCRPFLIFPGLAAIIIPRLPALLFSIFVVLPCPSATAHPPRTDVRAAEEALLPTKAVTAGRIMAYTRHSNAECICAMSV